MDNKAVAKKLNALSNRMISVQALDAYLRPRLAKPHIAMDTKPLGIMAKVFDGVTGKNFKDQKPAIAKRFRELSKDKIAKDASLDDVEKVLDMLDGHEVESGDESVSEAQHNAMEAAAHGASNVGIPKKVGQEFADADKGKTFDAEPFKAFLKEKGMGEDDINTAMGMVPKPNALDEDPEEKKKREESEKKAADEKAEEDKKEAEKKAQDAMKDMVSKPAMDAAISAATDATAKKVRETERGIRAALEKVRPFVGELAADLAFDSADDVFRHAAVVLEIPGAKTIHASALPTIIEMQPKPGARPVDRNPLLGMDAAALKSADDRFGLARITPA